MLFYVECGVEFTNMYGDINEYFYYSIESHVTPSQEVSDILVKALAEEEAKKNK